MSTTSLRRTRRCLFRILLVQGMAEGKTMTQAAIDAGYSDKNPDRSGWQALKTIRQGFRDAVEGLNLTPRVFIEKYVVPGMSATSVQRGSYLGGFFAETDGWAFTLVYKRPTRRGSNGRHREAGRRRAERVQKGPKGSKTQEREVPWWCKKEKTSSGRHCASKGLPRRHQRKVAPG